MKLYKIIKRNKSCNGGDFDWSEYLPKGKRPGKWTPVIKGVSECERGYHVTPYWNMWYDEGCEVYECEVKGMETKNEPGVVDKYVCTSIRLTRKCVFTFDQNSNTGDWNTGDHNSGDRNTGNWNTGYKNPGNLNTGYWNTGDRNTGDSNTGNWNTGNLNTGYWNTGNLNTGYKNTGDRNTGYKNTGDRNTGYKNTGNWNSSNNHVGSFNSKEPKYVELFNKPIAREKYLEIKWPAYFYFRQDGTYSKSWKKAFSGASLDEIKNTIALPNFDYDVFEEITGITIKMIQKKLRGGGRRE